MPSLNRVELIGHLGRDPELKYTNGGKAVVKFSVATSFGSGDQEQTEWHNVVAWEKQAEACNKVLSKGDLVHVEGRMVTRSYEKDGVKRYSTDVVAHRVLFLKTKGRNQAEGSSSSSNDEIPF